LAEGNRPASSQIPEAEKSRAGLRCGSNSDEVLFTRSRKRKRGIESGDGRGDDEVIFVREVIILSDESVSLASSDKRPKTGGMCQLPDITDNC